MDLITLQEAHARILGRAKPVDAERVPVERAAGRVLAAPAVAACDLPPFPSSAMDGYAIRSVDTAAGAASLALVGRIVTGTPADRPLAAGEALAISTGGVVPEGADAVVPLELVTEADGRLQVTSPVAAGANVRSRGGDVRQGGTVLEPGIVLGAAQVGALAAAGIGEVQCRKRPRVGILVTGSELRAPGEPLGPGQIYESNGLMLAAQLTAVGAVPAQLGVASDDEDELERAMERALIGFEMLVTSGGASVGVHDLVRKVQKELRVEELFWGVSIRPGKPVAFGARRDHLVFNLPGNPVSALVCFELFVRPAVNALLGVPDPLPAFDRAVLGAPVRRNPERDDFVRARTVRDGAATVVEPLSGQESHMIVAAAHADALVHVERGEGEIAAGAEVGVLRLA